MGWEEWKAERERRNQIRNQINSLRNQMGEISAEITKMKEIIYFYEDIKRTINENAEAWNQQYGVYSSLELAPEIQVTDSFEGISANQLSLDVPQTIDVMSSAANQMATVLPGIAEQIRKIEDYIAELEVKKQGLQAQIDTLLGEL